MDFQLLSVEQIVKIHDSVLNKGELEGQAGDKSLEGALSRVEFRIQYGMVSDVYDLAAIYVVAISQAHVFNDANKRTAYAAMEFCFSLHDIEIVFEIQEIGDVIIEVAQGNRDENELAAYLRRKKLEE